jgi:hypothetical protein
MISVVGTYDNGHLKLYKDYVTKSPVKVIVPFLEDIQSKSDNELSLKDFSFSKSQNNLKTYQGSLADAVIDERRVDL